MPRFGGARRDEEKARAKERIYSFRDKFGQWDPKNQRPELWNLYNARIDKGRNRSASSRSPIGLSSTSGHYIHVEKIPVVPPVLSPSRARW
jgi:sulfate adenylyltransferase subunit 2